MYKRQPQEPGRYFCRFRLSEQGEEVARSRAVELSVQPAAEGERGILHVRDNWTLVYDDGTPFRGVAENICLESRANDDSKFFKELHEMCIRDRGQTGAPKVNLSMNYGFTSASSLQKGTSAYEYALMRNEAIRHDQRSFSGTESLSTYIYDDYDLWKFRNNRDYTPVELDARGDLTAAQKELLKNQPALYYASRDLYKEMFLSLIHI